MGLPRWHSRQRTYPPMQEMQETQVWSLGWEDPLQNGNTPQDSCLGTPRYRGAWKAAGHRVAELDTTEAT